MWRLLKNSIPTCLKRPVSLPKFLWNNEASSGFTFIELIVVTAVTITLSAVAIPTYRTYIERAKTTKAIAEIRLLGTEILAFYAVNESLPITLDEMGRATLKDPWGTPYVFLNIINYDMKKGGTKVPKGPKGTGKPRKDRFLVPINSDYDLYSMGPDGKTIAPLTAKNSRDDILRANNGTFIGPASEF